MSDKPWSLLQHPVTAALRAMQIKAAERRRLAGFNLCAFVSDQSHYENLHSDIIAALLDPHGDHGEGPLFVPLLVRWLKTHYLLDLPVEAFCEACVEREKGRVDVLVFDVRSRQAIIIENKMNDAVDQDRQLDRYVEFAEQRKLTVRAIVYLSLNGAKFAPPMEAGLDHLVCNAPAFADDSADLVNGWLLPCQQSAAQFATKAFIAQYIALIQSLASMSFDLTLQEAFYNHLSTHPEHLQDLDALVQLRDSLPAYRARCFAREITNPRPFAQFLQYGPHQHYWLLQGWQENGESWKLDVIFEPDAVKVGFWNPSRDQTKPSPAVPVKLASVGMLEAFQPVETFGNGLKRVFGSEHGSLKERDAAATAFVKTLLEAFRAGDSAAITESL